MAERLFCGDYTYRLFIRNDIYTYYILYDTNEIYTKRHPSHKYTDNMRENMNWEDWKATKEALNTWKNQLDFFGPTVHEDLSPSQIQHWGWWRHLFAGAAAGFTSRTTTAPLDRLKVFLQVNHEHNIRSAFHFLHKEGGFLSFWRGNGINVLKIAPESAIKFMVYDEVKKLIKWSRDHQELNLFDRFLAGASAGAIAQALIYPLEVLKTRLVLRRTGEIDSFHHLPKFIAKMYRNEGIHCFYKGFVPNFVGIIPYAGIDLAVYETLKNFWLKRHPDTNTGIFAIICGIASSTVGQIFTYPFALIRTRLQAVGICNNPNHSTTMSGQISYISRNEGPKGFYRGFIPNYIKVMPAVSVSYFTYEYVREKLGAKMA